MATDKHWIARAGRTEDDPAARRARNEARRLAERETSYRMMFEHALDAMLLIVPDGPIVAANPAACALFGMSEAELIARGRAGMMDMDDPRLPPAVAARTKLGNFHGQLCYVRKDGSRFEGEVSSSLFRGPTGELLASLVIRDVSERIRMQRELAEERDFATKVLRMMGEGLVVTDALDRFEFVNDAFARILGTTAESLIGKTPGDVTAPEDRGVLARQMKLRSDGRTDSFESRLVRADGALVPVVVTAVPRGGAGDYRGSIAVVSDLSERPRHRAGTSKEDQPSGMASPSARGSEPPSSVPSS